MKHFISLLVALFFTLGIAEPALLAKGGHPKSSGSRTVHVRSYTKKNGTVVHAHTRTAPSHHR
ncbi:MAG TPA: hypothetical protein VHI13_04450 [Candidatus Kapabacteria bacterium]|nr:hypothetical protein [Candidatus Kapabacteria bacterium]